MKATDGYLDAHKDAKTKHPKSALGGKTDLNKASIFIETWMASSYDQGGSNNSKIRIEGKFSMALCDGRDGNVVSVQNS